jgi:chaperonin GroEL
MAHKQLLFKSAAREKVLKGATELAEAVRVTPGSEIQVRLDGEEVGPADRLQRRRNDCERGRLERS